MGEGDERTRETVLQLAGLASQPQPQALGKAVAGVSGKKSSTVTKIILKEAAKPHHNLSERVAQVCVPTGGLMNAKRD